MMVVDQHDKWKYKLGLALHIRLDPFNGYIKWLKVWWNNSNLKVISSYFLEEIAETGGKWIRVCFHQPVIRFQ